jgi:hypothetical protein
MSDHQKQYSDLEKIKIYEVGFEVLTAVVMKSTIFWDMTPCSPLSCNGRFGETCRLASLLPACLLVLADIILRP